MCRSKLEAPPDGRRCPSAQRRPGARTTRLPLTSSNVEDAASGVRQARTTVAAEAAIDGATRPLLLAVARELGATVTTRSTVAQLRTAILGQGTPAPLPTAGAGVEDAVRAAYASLARRPQGWVSLTDLRAHLSGHDRSAVDAALIRLEQSGVAAVIPEDDQQRLTPTDRANALRYGGSNLHRIAFH